MIKQWLNSTEMSKTANEENVSPISQETKMPISISTINYFSASTSSQPKPISKPN